jgi:hypothetical protein
MGSISRVARPKWLGSFGAALTVSGVKKHRDNTAEAYNARGRGTLKPWPTYATLISVSQTFEGTETGTAGITAHPAMAHDESPPLTGPFGRRYTFDSREWSLPSVDACSHQPKLLQHFLSPGLTS